MGKQRCKWCASDSLLIMYHDHEWGKIKNHDDQLFEALTLEVFQSGLSWRTVLHKRARLNEVFGSFDPTFVARLTEEDILRLVNDKGIIRHRKKIEATIKNANILLGLIETFGSFRLWLDQFPIEVELKQKKLKETFHFVGMQTAESFLEAIGEIQPNHDEECFLHHVDH